MSADFGAHSCRRAEAVRAANRLMTVAVGKGRLRGVLARIGVYLAASAESAPAPPLTALCRSWAGPTGIESRHDEQTGFHRTSSKPVSLRTRRTGSEKRRFQLGSPFR